MAWPTTLTAGDFLSGEGADSESGTTIFQMLYDRQQEVAGAGFSWVFRIATISSTSWTSISTTTLRCPEWALNSESAIFKIAVQYDRAVGATGNLEIRVKETSTATTGGTVTVTPTTSYQTAELTVAVPDDTWETTWKDFEVESRHAAGATGNHRVGAYTVMNAAFTIT